MYFPAGTRGKTLNFFALSFGGQSKNLNFIQYNRHIKSELETQKDIKMRVIYDKKTMNCPLKVFDGKGKNLIDEKTLEQAKTYCSLPFVVNASLMPDAHYGKGSTVGSVIATDKVIIPATVGVDIGCGMMAVKTTLKAEDLPESLSGIRSLIEEAVPHGRTDNGGSKDKGGWRNKIPNIVTSHWNGSLEKDFKKITEKHPQIAKSNHVNHLGSLGTGNHFIELCLDLKDDVWIMLHSGSRGVGNRIGQYFISLAKEEMKKFYIRLPDADLAYLSEGSLYFWDYFQAVNWAQEFAKKNREIMMANVTDALQKGISKTFKITDQAINCHHNYIAKEKHFGKDVWTTRKGAVKAEKGDLGIIPGSMGAKSFIVRGKGDKNSLNSCSHGAGRLMSRMKAKKTFQVKDLEEQTKGIECKKDSSVIDEIPKAYKPIEKVMQAQSDLVEIIAELRQIVCVKG